MKAGPKTSRCALYTRKSSDEGLDQAFNSLDAQREACEAYVASQKNEGWKALSTRYDDGGYSGGTMERPALKRLIADIEAGRIDSVIVYKIDRLTRSLADFARMVELFDRYQVSFVSVTQSFSTTSSMGRLTLNMLLSFAQFEREVTGERIRDKIAASKARGMWMGGVVPLGYDKAPGPERTLIINETEAKTVRDIFHRYIELGSVHALERDLRARDIRTKRTQPKDGTSSDATTRGGGFFSRGALFHLLRNRLYLGEITHRDKTYPGLHPAIIAQDLFDQVQAGLASRRRRISPTGASKGKVADHALTGRIFDALDHPMSPTFSYGASGKLYRYYVSAPLQQGKPPSKQTQHRLRISANLIETHLASRLRNLLAVDANQSQDILSEIIRIELHDHFVKITLAETAPPPVPSQLAEGESLHADPRNGSRKYLILPFHLSSRKGRTIIRAGDKHGPTPDRTLIQALRKAHSLVPRDGKGLPLLAASPAGSYNQRLIPLAFLAPDIQREILTGNHPPGLTLAGLMAHPLPVLWSEQRKHIEKIAVSAGIF